MYFKRVYTPMEISRHFSLWRARNKFWPSTNSDYDTLESFRSVCVREVVALLLMRRPNRIRHRYWNQSNSFTNKTVLSINSWNSWGFERTVTGHRLYEYYCKRTRRSVIMKKRVFITRPVRIIQWRFWNNTERTFDSNTRILRKYFFL